MESRLASDGNGRSVFHRRPILLLCLVVLAVYTVLILRYAEVKFDGNITGFMCIGDSSVPADVLPDGVLFQRNSAGYDGQFFYLISRDPFILTDLHQYLDNPSYRYQRVLYPALAALFSLGRVEAIPFMFLFINVISIVIGTAVVAKMLRTQALSPWYALSYGLLSGMFLAVLRDLSGPLSSCFMVVALYYYSKERIPLCSLALALAILTRETTILVVPVLVFDSLILRRSPRRAVIAALPVLAFVGWQLYIGLRLGAVPTGGGQHVFTYPLVGMIHHVGEVLFSPGRPPSERAYLVLVLLASWASLALAFREVMRSRNEISFGFLGFSFLPIMLSESVWVEPWAYGRVLLPAAIFMILAFVRSKDRLYLIPMGLQGASFVVLLFWVNLL